MDKKYFAIAGMLFYSIVLIYAIYSDIKDDALTDRVSEIIEERQFILNNIERNNYSIEDVEKFNQLGKEADSIFKLKKD